jgi:GNAT superfamily N-acetyltransferase
MRVGDVAQADRLREQAGWNQTLADWQRILTWEPRGCFVAEQQGQIVGTVTTTIFGPELAWIGMMLVDRDARRHGIGRRLLAHALEWLEGVRGVRCVGLDATPQGKLLYDSMGFVEAYTLHRRHGLAPRLEASPAVRRIDASALSRLVDLDHGALGVDRTRLLRDLCAAHPTGCFVLDGERPVLGYALTRPGARRWHVGPVVARDAPSARLLLHAALARLADQPVVIDTLDTNQAASRLADELGLVAVRPFIRMWRGQPLPTATPHNVCFGIVGPEVG